MQGLNQAVSIPCRALDASIGGPDASTYSITRFEQEYMGRGPKDIQAFLITDLLVVRLRGVLTAAEQQLVKTLAAEKGRDLLKQVRTHLIETARPVMEAMVQEITGVGVLSLLWGVFNTWELIFRVQHLDEP